jgi:hypothetical protein
LAAEVHQDDHRESERAITTIHATTIAQRKRIEKRARTSNAAPATEGRARETLIGVAHRRRDA